MKTSKQIYVLEGTYRNRRIENQQFELIKCYQPYPHKEGGFVTVKIKDLAQYQAPKSTIRIVWTAKASCVTRHQNRSETKQMKRPSNV